MSLACSYEQEDPVNEGVLRKKKKKRSQRNLHLIEVIRLQDRKTADILEHVQKRRWRQTRWREAVSVIFLHRHLQHWFVTRDK